MSNSVMSEAFKAEFSASLALQGKPPMEHFLELVAIAEKHEMMYVLVSVHCKLFLVHMENRGGLLISPPDAHKNGAEIKAAGADLDQLSNAFCFELPEAGPRRAAHLAKNEALVKRAEGLVAPLNGAERFVSIGCGHTSQFCKLAALGGDTCEPSLKIPGTNKIDKQKLCSNVNYDTMINKGWTWKVFRACVDEAFPKFSEIAQLALNTRNHVSAVVGEIEVAMVLSKRACELSRSQALDHIERSCAPCSKYAGVIFDYVVNFAGGSDASIIQFVDGVAKQFTANVALGESYWRALAYTEFAEKTRKYPLVRAAFLLANLSSDKIEDGVARCLSKTDLKQIASKTMIKPAVIAEDHLADAFVIVRAISTVETCLKPLGQLFVRSGLKLAGAERKGREGKVYTWRQIREAFIAGVAVAVGSPVTFDKWDDYLDDDDDDNAPAAHKVKACMQSKSVSADTGPTTLATLDDHSDPVWICSQAGFTVGGQVVEKKIEAAPEHLYVIFQIEEEVQLRQVVSYCGAPRKVSVSIKELLNNWQVSKMEAPVVMMDAPASLPVSFEEALKKNEVFKALHGLHAKHTQHIKDLSYYRRPDHVRTKAFMKAKSLMFVPISPPANIFHGMKPGSISIGECCIVPPAKPPLQEPSCKWENKAFVASYWWVNKTTDRKLANMTEETVKFGGIDIPVLKNSCDLEPFTKLLVYSKPRAATKPLTNAKCDADDADDDDDDDDEVDAVAAKAKARAKGKSSAKRTASQPKAEAKKKGKK